MLALSLLLALASAPACRRDQPPPETPPAASEPDAGADAATRAEMIWIVRTTGEQCSAEPVASLAQVVGQLQDLGVTVHESEMTTRVVCAACGCPNAEFYRVQIEASDFSRLEGEGWQRE